MAEVLNRITPDLKGVPETLLIPLWARAQEQSRPVRSSSIRWHNKLWQLWTTTSVVSQYNALPPKISVDVPKSWTASLRTFCEILVPAQSSNLAQGWIPASIAEGTLQNAGLRLILPKS